MAPVRRGRRRSACRPRRWCRRRSTLNPATCTGPPPFTMTVQPLCAVTNDDTASTGALRPALTRNPPTRSSSVSNAASVSLQSSPVGAFENPRSIFSSGMSVTRIARIEGDDDVIAQAVRSTGGPSAPSRGTSRCSRTPARSHRRRRRATRGRRAEVTTSAPADVMKVRSPPSSIIATQNPAS